MKVSHRTKVLAQELRAAWCHSVVPRAAVLDRFLREFAFAALMKQVFDFDLELGLAMCMMIWEIFWRAAVFEACLFACAVEEYFWRLWTP